MTVRDVASDGLILVGALCALAGVYLLLGLAVALIALGMVVAAAGVAVDRKVGR